MPIKMESNSNVSLDYTSEQIKIDIQNLSQNAIYAQINHIHITHITIEQAKELVEFLKKPEQALFIADISLPPSLQNTRVQVELDNLISDHRTIKNIRQIGSTIAATPIVIPKTAEDRKIPETIKPKIEIILYEDESVNVLATKKVSELAVENAELKDTRQLPKLERSPLAAQIVEQIISDNREAAIQWSLISKRSEAKTLRDAKALREKWYPDDKSQHPLNNLLKHNKALKNQLARWTKELKLKKEQYDALLDVCGQYGTKALTELFTIWDSYPPDEKAIFKELHDSLLQYMPTYLPFIEDNKFKETIASIMKLSDAQRSWWMALIKNHGLSSGYSDLKGLFECFEQAVPKIQSLIPSFNIISQLKTSPNDLYVTLSNMIHVLTKCHERDRAVQWECLSQVDFANMDSQFHFLVPEMEKKSEIELDSIKALIETNSFEYTKTAFYRFIATRKQHLPLRDYKQILETILNEKNFNMEKPLSNSFKIKMVYVLAKATSVDSNEKFDAQNVLKEWNDFQDRYVKLEYLVRIRANYGIGSRALYDIGLRVDVGGPSGVRQKAIAPFIDMQYIPPMSFLNKLNNLSEYKFLDPTLQFKDMKAVQRAMITSMNFLFNIYKIYPDSMLQAVRLIKTETIAKKNEQFIPEERDRGLLEKFKNACEILTSPVHNDAALGDNKPLYVLLPLLTVFYLEYESKETLEKIINDYKERISGIKYPEYKETIQKLLPYGLSLLQHIQHRENLNAEVLNTIQETLLNNIGSGLFTTRQAIRQWIETNYGGHFKNGEIPKDTVDINHFFDEFKCNPETRNSIQLIVDYFNLEEEKAEHKGLVESLIKLEQTLTALQKKRFFEYCIKALGKEGLLSREKQNSPPSYLKQFKSLIDVIESNQSFDQFEQVMNITRKQILESGDDKKGIERNSIEKCRYFLETLYPALIKDEQKLTPKDAFSFAALVCRTPLEVLCVHQARFTGDNEIMLPENKEHVDNALKIINLFKNKKSSSSTNYNNLLRQVNILRQLDQKNETTYIAISNHINEIIRNNNSWTGWVFSFVTRNGEVQKLNKMLSAIRPLQLMSFSDVVLELHRKKQQLKNKYHTISAYINDFISKAVIVSSDYISETHYHIGLLVEHLMQLNDQNLTFNLIYHYNGLAGRRPVTELIGLFERDSYQKLSIKTVVMNAILTQLNNGIDCPQETIYHFLDHIYLNRNNKLVIHYLHQYYEHAPFLSLDTFIAWTQPPIDEKELQNKYAKFDKHPCALQLPDGRILDGREKENGFKLNKARENLEKWPQVKGIFTEDYLNEIHNATIFVKHLSTDAILQQLKKFKDQHLTNHIMLVILVAELLHRCKGRTPKLINGKQKSGRSFELNTTQIMAILAMLETGKRVTSEIGTGEGKSRIMMIINACQFLKGNTVDPVTDNLALAERDYLASLPFLKSLGAEVSFITNNSAIEDYKIGGINFSDKKNLATFRDKAANQNRLKEVLDPNPAKRSLSLDEADTLFLDNTNINYNDSKTIPEVYRKILPLYPILMNFFAEEGNEGLYKSKQHKCTERLLDYIKRVNPPLYDIILALPDATTRLAKWQDAAYTARHLKFGDPSGFTIATNVTVSTPLGPKNVAKAFCYDGPRIDENAIFSEGVHQCLHAELNRLMRGLDTSSKIKDKNLQSALEQCHSKGFNFEIFPERPTSFSNSSADAILKYYKKGSLYAVTGTIGSNVERPEVQSLVNTQLLDVPRHNGLNRFDRPARIMEDEEAQFKVLVAHILECRAKHQPILFICKDDNESKWLQDKLKVLRLIPQDQLNRIHAVTDYEDERLETEVIKIAGKPNHLLLTTAMEGRGTDIELEDEAQTAGLKVLLTYLPKSQRELEQVLGRTARLGATGETQMVLNLKQLKNDYRIDGLNEDYYLNPEAFIRQLQLFAEHTDQLHRLFKMAFNHFFKCFKKGYKKLGIINEQMSQAWNQFLENHDNSKKIVKEAIELMLKEEANLNSQEIEKELNNHVIRVTQYWDSFLIESGVDKNVRIPAAIPLPKLLSDWMDRLKAAKNNKTMTMDVVQKVTVYKKYDPAMAGRMHIVTNPGERPWFANTSAFWNNFNFSKWWRGEGKGGTLGTGIQLFANLHAYWRKEISLSTYLMQCLPFFRHKSVNEEHIVKKKIPTIHADQNLFSRRVF